MRWNDDAEMTPVSRWADRRSQGGEQSGEKRMPNVPMLTQQVLSRLWRLTPREAEALCWMVLGQVN